MSITSFSYFVFICIGAIVYYILPKSLQWIELLLLSIVFYCMVANPYTIIYLVITTFVAWGVTNRIGSCREKRMVSVLEKYGDALICFSILFFVALWFVVKGRPFILFARNIMGMIFPCVSSIRVPELPAALGMGYYTLQIIGYILDCYWETIRPQRNIFKLFLFVIFFPQLTTGPISRYGQLIAIYEKHKFSYLKITHGAQRILWGLFKKIVIAERAGLFVNGIWRDPATFGGFYIWIAILLYPIQMYADFSGCMDIVIGTAELFDIKLAENFNNPFFAKTSQEFWQRWHITLGNWAKDYVLYPVLKCKAMIRFGKFAKKTFGKRSGKFLTTAIGMFALWMIIGIWHGGVKYVVGVSLWYWIVLMLGELTAPYFAKITLKLGFHTDSFSWELFRRVRTYVIYAIGAVFFRASRVKEGVIFLKTAISVIIHKEYWNPWILFDGSVLNLGISYRDINILILSVLLMLCVAVLREKYGYARNWIDQQCVLFRWTVWLGLFTVILIYGMYGPGFDASDFIYQGF